MWFRPSHSVDSFNRTTMELKPWNASEIAPNQPPFNRTTMELKPFWPQCQWPTHTLLIEPLWNWNDGETDYQSPSKCLLIEPLWNWNSLGRPLPTGERCLLIEPLWNWNFFLANGGTPTPWLLIEPLWNWNRHTPWRCLCRTNAFNRTTMELKLVKSRFRPISPDFLLIEPLWNWNMGPI